MPERRPSHLAAAGRLVLSALGRDRRGGGGRVVEPARKLAVERRGIEVDPADLRRYLGATRGPQPAEADPLLPPTFTAVWETALTLELLSFEGMPFPSRGIVHLGSEIVVVRSLRLGDRVRFRLELERMEAHSGGLILALKCRSWNAAGQLCQENATTLLVRGVEAAIRRAPPGGVEREEGGSPGEGSERRWRELSAWDLPRGAGVRYARASGDFNPIHLWAWSSRLLGFSRPILHGHCTLAMIAHEINRATGRSLRRLSGRFRAPLELPARVRLEVAGDLEERNGPLRLVAFDGAAKPYVEGSWVG